jgi:arylsulfatase A
LPAGRETSNGKTNHVSAFWDFLPTTCELAGLKTPAKTDGISYLPTLTGQSGKQKNHEYLYWEFHEKGTSKAIRMGNWKGIKPGLERPLELYDLSSDMGETTNVAEGHPDIVRKMEALLISARTESSIWPAR